jgi:ABC-type antimicrobial peptide transport system permease subunit
MRKLVNAVGLPELADQLGLTYTKPLPVIGIAAVCAFAVAVIAALLPLGRMQREPIVESLRGFD